MSKLDDNLRWIKQYHAGKLWLTKLKSRFTRKQYLGDLKKYCDGCMHQRSGIHLKVYSARA